MDLTLRYYWGEPERAPHTRDERSQSLYYTYLLLILFFVWYVRHARTAINIIQRCAVYLKRPHENICASL